MWAVLVSASGGALTDFRLHPLLLRDVGRSGVGEWWDTVSLVAGRKTKRYPISSFSRCPGRASGQDTKFSRSHDVVGAYYHEWDDKLQPYVSHVRRRGLEGGGFEGFGLRLYSNCEKTS